MTDSTTQPRTAKRSTAPATPMHIRLENVTKRYGSHVILNEVSLEVSPGETVALIGPSGGGKSTLLRCLNGLNSIDAGSIQIGPHTLNPSRATNPKALSDVRKLLGMVFQDFQLFPHLTAIQNVMEAPVHVLKLSRAEARDRGMRLLQRVGLADRSEHYPRQLSGGQKQRVAIARALAMEPKGLLCDEITSALDPELKGEVLDVLEDLKRDGMTLLMVTHEIGFARRAADRVVVLDGGRIIDNGPPSEILENSSNPRTKLFLSRVLI